MASQETIHPNRAGWHVLLVIGRNVPGAPETDYVDCYYIGDRPKPSQYRKLVPEGWKQIGRAEVTPIPEKIYKNGK